MLNLNRRTLLRSTGIAGVATFASTLFPELSPITAFANSKAAPKDRPWYAEKGIAREATAAEGEKAGHDYLPRLARAMSDAKIQGPTGLDHRASMAVHTLQDGRSILAWSKPLDDTHVVAIYSETDARGHRGRSQVFVWEIDPLTKAGRVAAQGPALEKLYKTTSVATGAVLPAAHAISCGPGTYVCSYCVSFDGGFTDCCGPCGFAFLGGLVSGLSCVLIWCNWCVWEHCASFAESCCSA